MIRFKIILLFSLIVHTGLISQTFEVTIDTIHLDIKEIVQPVSRVDLSHVVKFQNKYYCFFRERGLYFFQKDTRYFLIISKDGSVLNQIDIPNEIKDSNYFDFFQKRDSLIVKTYMHHDSFYFDNKMISHIRYDKSNTTDLETIHEIAKMNSVGRKKIYRIN